MDNIEQKIKPSNWFTIMLFVFMAIIFLSAIIYYSTANILHDNINLISKTELILSIVIDVLAYSYAFMSIYKALQAKPYSIAMLKLSVIYILLQPIVRLLNDINILIQVPKITLGWLAFLIIFLIFLYKSKHLEEYIPQPKRRFGFWGFAGVFIYLLVFATIVMHYYDIIYKTIASRPVDTNAVILNEYEQCDKISAFVPLANWKNDTIIGTEDDGYMYMYHSDNCNKIRVASLCGDFPKKIDYYGILKFMQTNVMPDTIKMYEVMHRDSAINGNKFYLNSYTFTDDTLRVFWTFAAIKDAQSYKITTLSCFELDSLKESVNMTTEFMKTVRFDLKD